MEKKEYILTRTGLGLKEYLSFLDSCRDLLSANTNEIISLRDAVFKIAFALYYTNIFSDDTVDETDGETVDKEDKKEMTYEDYYDTVCDLDIDEFIKERDTMNMFQYRQFNDLKKAYERMVDELYSYSTNEFKGLMNRFNLMIDSIEQMMDGVDLEQLVEAILALAEINANPDLVSFKKKVEEIDKENREKEEKIKENKDKEEVA